MFIGGFGGAGIAVGTTMALSLPSRRGGSGGFVDVPVSPEVYEAFQEFKEERVLYRYYLREEQKVIDALDTAEKAFKAAIPFRDIDDSARVFHNSKYIRKHFDQFARFSGEMQTVRDAVVAFTTTPTPPCPSCHRPNLRSLADFAVLLKKTRASSC